MLLVSCRQRFKKARLALLSGSLNDHRSLIVNDGSSQTDRKAGGISTKSLAPEQLTYSVKEVAELLGVTDKTVYRLLARRLLRSLKPLRHHRIPKTELERFLQENL